MYLLFQIKQMLLRLFPVGRGIFEDKVSNVWCAVNVFVKLRKLYPADTLLFVCAVTTGALSLPSNILLFLKPTRQNFLLALINTSLVFFLFSFQVYIWIYDLEVKLQHILFHSWFYLGPNFNLKNLLPMCDRFMRNLFFWQQYLRLCI